MALISRFRMELCEHRTRIAQLHIFATSGAPIARHLAFRDYLRAHPEEVRAYEVEKRPARLREA